MKKIAIIPARGGSKRIPNKNIRLFLDKPIISYAIKNAIDTNIFNTIMVSTDSYDIAKIAKDYGAEVPFMRSIKNSSDYATTKDVILEVLNQYKIINMLFDYFCCIYPCTPLLKSDDIKNSMLTTIQGDYETLFPVIKYHSPIFRSIIIDDNNKPKRFYSEFENTRTQDLPETFYDAGQYYCGNVKLLLNSQDNGLLTKNTKCIVIDSSRYQDIDNEEDWKLAEIKYLYNKNL
jgi:pseudaminic acid cytidylyltransferase